MPREDSGSQARRYEAALTLTDEAEEILRGRASQAAISSMIAIKPGILSFEDGVGCT